MISEVKTKWLESLRSGDYSQGTNKLFDGKSYCCLGVLCDLYQKQSNQQWDQKASEFELTESFYCNDQSEVLSDDVANWAGLDSNNPTVLNESSRVPLAELNDSGYTFQELSNYIEEQF